MTDRLTTLRSEFDTDPLARGYTGMTDQEAADDINTEYRTLNRVSMTSSEVLNAVVESEYSALSNADKDRLWQILSIGTLNPFGVEATLMLGIFGGGSETITSLNSSRTKTVSRGAELGIGVVYAGTVQQARAL